MANAHPTQPVRPGRPSTIEQGDLIAAALALGPDDLVLRKIADALEVPRTTVYNHVRGPQDLGSLVLSSILEASLAASTSQSTEGQPWAVQLEAFAVRLRIAQLAAGPWLRYYDRRVHLSRDTLRAADHLVEVLVGAGFSPESAGRALVLISSVVENSVQTYRHAFPPEGPWAAPRPDPYEFPWLAAARVVVDDPQREDKQFHYDLRCALTGIAAELA